MAGHAGPVDGVPGGEVVGAVEHHVGAGHQAVELGRTDTLADRGQFDLRIERRQRRQPGSRLVEADSTGVVQDLALQVGEIDRVAVDQCQPADARRSQVHRCGRAEPAGADDQRRGGADARLPFDADLLQQDVARIAQQLVVVHGWLPAEAGAGRRRRCPRALRRRRCRATPALRRCLSGWGRTKRRRSPASSPSRPAAP